MGGRGGRVGSLCGDYDNALAVTRRVACFAKRWCGGEGGLMGNISFAPRTPLEVKVIKSDGRHFGY